MKSRRMFAATAVLLALAGHGMTQGPKHLPGTPGDAGPMVVEPGPGRAIIAVPEDPPTAPPEGTVLPEKMPPKAPPPTPAAPDNPIPQITNGCDGNSCKPCLAVTHMGPAEQFWFSTSYLYWWLDDMPMDSVLGVQNGATVIGGGPFDFGRFNGVRVGAGMWFDCQHVYGMEIGGFILERKGTSTTLSSDGSAGSPTITRPVFDSLTNTQISVLVGGQGLAGSLNVDTSIDLGSAEFSFTRNLLNNQCYTLTALLGGRYIVLDEDLTITQVSQQTGGAATLPFAGQTGFNRITATDNFHTRNQFWAGQVGARFEARRGIYFGSVTSKVALGPNKQTSNILGESTATGPAGTPPGQPSGVLALTGANAGTDTTRWFTVAPEVGVQVGLQLTPCIRTFIGYDFLYINNVVRPGDLVNTTINQGLVPISGSFGTTSGPAQPFRRTSRDDFVAHGIEVGLQLAY